MSRINSKKKGSRNERRVVKLLEEWSNREFARTPSSGGLRWKRTSDTVGDIVCTEERHFFPFSIEVKTRKEINFEHLLYLENSEILKFWKQATGDAERGHKIPLLFMRYNGMPSQMWFIVIYFSHWKIFKKYFNLSYPVMVLNKNIVIARSEVLLKGKYKRIRKKAITMIDEKWPK